MTKAHVTAAFLLGGSLIGGNALAAEPLVEIIRAGASVGTYADFDAGMKAAAPGDTMKFLRDFVPEGYASWKVTKPLTLDLDGHAATNSLNFNFFIVQDSPVVFKNGIIGNTGSAAIAASGDVEVHATNVVFKTCGFAADSDGAALHAGSGCVFLSALIATWPGARGRVFVEDGSVVSTHSSFFSGSSTRNLFVRGGMFAADPSAYAVGPNKTVAREVTTAHGACHYVVEARGPDEPGVAGLVLGEGLTNVWDTVDEALALAREGDAVALLADVGYAKVGTYTGLRVNRRLTLDLNGHTLSNAYGHSVLVLNADGVVIRNGTLSGQWNGMLNLAADHMTAYASNVVFRSANSSKPNTAVVNSTKTGTKAFLRGCVVEPNVTLRSPKSVNNNDTPCTASLDIEDTDAYVTASAFTAGAESSVLRVLSGRFVADPLSCLAEGSYASPISEKTALGDLKYSVFPISDEKPLTLDLSAADAVKVLGALPDGTTTIHVAFTDSGSWTGRRKLVADFSQLANADGLSVSVGSFPSAFGTRIEVSLVDGKLYARVRRGLAVIVR